jgi:hypothetical protein
LTPGGSSIHLHTNSTQNTENGTHITITRKKLGSKLGSTGYGPVFASYTLAFALQLRKKHGKTSVRVVEESPDIPVAVVQHIFTHKQYTEHKHYTEETMTHNTHESSLSQLFT